MSGTRCPNAWDKRPRYVAYVPTRVRLVTGNAPVMRPSFPVRPGRKVVGR